MLGKKGSAVVAGTKSGNASIWPVTHPVFIVKFYPTKISTASDDGYSDTLKTIKKVIPYTGTDSLWICSNTLSEYLYRQNFNTKEQVYLARRTSINGSLKLNGGKNDPETTGRIVYFDSSHRTNVNPAKDGVFYQKVLGLFIKNNRNFLSLSKDPEFNNLLTKPSSSKVSDSLKVWSFITDTNTKGSDKDGWTYTVDIKKNMEEFMNYNSLPTEFLTSSWELEGMVTYNTNGLDNNDNLKKYSITAIEELDLRYLDLLMTLNAISNNRTYWQNGIKSYMTDNKGAATLSITHGMVARMESLSTKGGDVEPATVFVSSNDLTQTAYNVKKDNNLSTKDGVEKVAKYTNSKVYNTRLKKAVELSGSKTYKSTGIYSTAIISRILSEEVRKIKDSKLVWGDSYNDAELIKLLKFQIKDASPWYGTNWALEPPIFSSVNYKAILRTDSTDFNKIKGKNGPLYSASTKSINLIKYYELTDPSKKYENTVTTNDVVSTQVSLNAIDSKGKKAGDTNEWKDFIKRNGIKNFKVKVVLYRDNGGSDFKAVGKLTQIHTGSKTWCTSDSWKAYTADAMLKLLEGNEPIDTWVDPSIASMELDKKKGEVPVNYAARVYIKYQAKDKKWYYTSGKEVESKESLSISSVLTKIPDVRESNKVTHTYFWTTPTITPTPSGSITPTPTIDIEVDYPSDSWSSRVPSLAYAEIKEGTIYNETFEAMAGVPSTRTLYFSSGGNEFMADLQVDYEHDTTATREYITHYNGTECEYKENDKLIGGTGKYSENLTFVGDSTGKTISKSVTAESSQIATPEGNNSGNITVSGHTGETTLWAQWSGSIDNGTQEPSDIGSFDAGKAGSPCKGKDYDVGKLRTKADPSTDWKVDAYNNALKQATKWATDMEGTNSSYTVQKIADSDGQVRQYKVGNAVITITLTGGSNGYSNTTQRSYGGGTYSSSSASAASLNSNDKGKLGSGWGWSPGTLGSGSGYSDCGHGHGATGWHTAPVAAVPPDKNGNGGKPAVPGVEHSHNCGDFNEAKDITQGASGTINYTIKVTFQNGTLTSNNSDGNSADVAATAKTGLSSLPAHALCGPCCDHDLPAIEDVWTQDLTYDTIKITKSNVYKLQNGYVTEMSDITYDGEDKIIAGITQGDPNIFYNIAAYNNPAYNKDKKLTNGSQIGRIRYSLQEAQGDKVYYEEMSNGEYKRTNKCDGLAKIQSQVNPAPPAKTGHELGYASGILYSNGKTAGFGTAPAVNITTEDFVSDNTATVTTPKTAYGNKLDSRDLKTEEWKRFYTRRTQLVTATVISDMLILQTSSGDQSPVYYEENTKAVKAQEDFNSLQASGDVEKASSQEQVDAKWNKMWTNNATTFAKATDTVVNVGSYNGKYNQTSSKYKGTGNNAIISTRFDNDLSVFSSPKDELGLARVTSNQTFTRPAYGTTNIASPGKAQARMNREKDLLLFVDKIKQDPTNSNEKYITGDSYIFYIPVLKYKVVGDLIVTVPEDAGQIKDAGEGEYYDDDGSGGDGDEISEAFEEEESDILIEAGYDYGPGLLYESKYSAYDDNSDYKVNDFIVLNAVAAQDAMIVKSEVEDQRTEEGIVKDAIETLKALEKCPGTPALCEYRALNCKYTLDTTSLSFNLDKIETENVYDDDASGTTDEYITNNIVNTDGAHTTYKLPEGFTLTSGDETYSGFGTGQFLKVAGAGTSLHFSYNDCKIYLTPTSRVRISADIYIPAATAPNTMLFSMGSVGLYLPANTGSPAFITSTGEKRTSSVNILGRKVKVVATFSLGSLYDCELSIDGTKVITQITAGLTEAQIAAAAIDESMRGDGLNIGCWEYNTSYATNFYTDNIVITRCGGTLEHTASCYTTYKQANPVYQDLYNGIPIKKDSTKVTSIDWTGIFNDGSYGIVSNYSKHVHEFSCLNIGSEGYQIALAEAKAGNWTALKKELGTDLFQKVVTQFNINDTNIPEGMLTKTYNGKLWGRVYYHDSTTGQYFANDTEVLNTNSTFKYSCLNQIQNLKTGSKYEFMLYYPENGQTNIWKQTNRPQDELETNSDGSQSAAGYEAVAIQMNDNFWGGLVKSTSGASLLDGSTYHDNWWYAIGSYAPYVTATGIPGGNNTIVNKVELWMAIGTSSGVSNVDSNTSKTAVLDTETEKVTQVPTVPSGTAYNFGYTGSYQIFTAPTAGTYTFETWGAQASGYYSGLGGYSKGNYTLASGQQVYIYVGGQYGYNGGGTSSGNGDINATTYGGGATDIRVGGSSLNNRVIVAGGGGGGNYSGSWYSGTGGNYASASYSLGQGQDYSHACSNYVGAGGGGYYGGAASSDGASYGGQGGSGYIGGVTNGSMTSGTRSGNGYATITLLSGETVSSYDTIITNNTVQNPTGVVKAGQTYTYGYTGGVQAITLPAGTYQLEAFGAAGGGNTASGTSRGSRGGKGGYTAGTVTLKETTTLYIYVGEKGNTDTGTAAGGWNGGGNAVWASTTKMGAGGGATDFRITAGNWNDFNSLKSRILVAGGGGGSDDTGEASGAYHSKQPGTYSTPLANDNDETGGAGGGINGGGAVTSGYEANYGYGTQTGGGTAAAGGVNGGFGYGGANTNSAADYGGGGGGYYGGASGGGAYQGGAGGSSYVSGYTGCDTTYRANQKYAAFTNVTLQQGVRAGNGYARVTVLDVKTIPEDNELFNFIKANMNLIPDKVTTDGVTIVNPIWNCKTRNNTGISYTEQTILTCTEPHHSSGHYDYASDICWDPCGKDDNHKHTKLEVIDANGTKVQQATYITLDNFFKIYYPNAGDFMGNDSYGILQPSVYRGKGYKQGMDTTEWTREKYVKFDFDVLYERRGVWESYAAGNWIPLEIIDASTTRKYALTGGTKLTIDGNTYVFDRANGLLQCNGGSTTLIEGNNMAVMNGKIFVWNNDGTVNVSDPCKEYNFYCLLENNEHACVEAQFAVEGINYDGQSTTEEPYTGNDSYEEEYDIYYYGNTYSTNKDRFSDFTSNHTAAKMAYLDVIGRIGNLIVEDSDDMRFSNYFKKSIAETNEDWLVQGIISRVDSSISEHYLSWHRNTAGYPLAVDVRGEQVSKEKGYYNTWGAQEWTTKAESNGLSLSADKNSKSILQAEQLKLGYNVLFDVTTMGDYNQYLQVIPYFYALNKTSGELTPVDVYINNDGNTQPINYFGLYSEYMDDSGNYKEGYDTLADKLYKYTMYLNWTEEATRRNYTAGGKEASNTDAVRDYFIEPVRDAEGEITTYKYLTVPFGNFYNLGTLQCLQPGVRARTFVGGSQVSAIKEQASRLGITTNGINGGIETNLDDEFVSEMFYHQAQRWHLSIGVPSSSTFVAYREKGIHLAPEDNWYVASYVEEGVVKTKQYSKAFLTANVAEKEYDVGTAFLISGTEYTITSEYQAGKEFNDNDDYVILMTADIKAIGDEWNLKYSTGNDNGYITVDGTTYTFDGTIPTFIAAYDTKSSLVDISIQHTH
ncbi:glycine rich domain-containing protein [Anaerocolumna sp. AGMB13020]|uniref:glycine rich domain-containing protein n=1 Tax=Anaerocolumna sp. AGMB13020 TaxID=3081750 RepID=UPI0029529733|nr:glycine rich domain-containing protein [Anaerocolumna sp. AGMB13020]WOO37861.1 glycine rich domain-containing protein [Anaerocolumna sp. AGMB13020]